MSITYASQRNNLSKAYPPENGNSFPDPEILPYTRPSDWLTLPSMTTSSQAFYGLYAVFDNNSNYVALSANTSSGSILVDWGDGTTDTVASGVQVNHAYTYSSISSGTLTTRGYRQALVTVTAVTGNLTNVNLQLKYVGTAAPNTTYTATANWLDIKVGSPFLNGLTISNNGPTVWMPLLEQFELVSAQAAGLSGGNAFRNLVKLQNFIWPSTGVPITSATFMFGSCASLVNAPSLPTFVTANLDVSGMFNLCFSLRNVPTYNFSGATNVNANNMFNGCSALRRAPTLINTSTITNWNAMFNGCTQLLYAPSYDTSGATNMASMFASCRTLVTAPYMNTVNCANMNAVFNGCTSLQNVPAYDLSNATNVSGMFQNCSTVKTLPSFKLTKLTLLDNMFTGCTSLTNIGALVTTGNLTAMNGTFINCLSLETAPVVTNIANVTTMYAVYNTCRSLKSIPDISTSMGNVANVGQVFINCSSLTTAPNLDLTKVTTAAEMFSGCTALTTVPTYNTSNLANTQSMFLNCNSLVTAPVLDLTKTTNTSQMFSGCIALQNADNVANTANVINAASMYATCTNLISAPNHNLSNNLNFNGMFTSCYSINSIPAYNMANATNAGGFSTTNLQVSDVLATGCKVTISVATCKLSKTSLETFMTNLGSNTTTQTLTITGNPGADAAINRSVTLTLNSQTGANTGSVTAGIVPGMYVTGTGISTAIGVTVTASTDKIVKTGATNFTPPVGTRVSFTTTANGLTAYTIYYIINYDGGGAFQVSTTAGGSAVNITSDGTMTMNFEARVESVTNSDVTFTVPASSAGAQNIAFRTINTALARLKNWTVTG